MVCLTCIYQEPIFTHTGHLYHNGVVHCWTHILLGCSSHVGVSGLGWLHMMTISAYMWRRLLKNLDLTTI